MSEYPLIPVETLARVKDELVARLAKLRPPVALEAGDLGDALGWSLLFEQWPELVPGAPDPESAFYNRYFWFKRYATLREDQHGYDAGIGQQIFQALEHVDFDVDWTLLEQLDAQAARIR